MAKNITIKVPGKHPQTGELTTFELKGLRPDGYRPTGGPVRLAAPAGPTQWQAGY